VALDPKRKKLIARLALLVTAIVVPLCIGEAVVRSMSPPRQPPHPIAVVCGNCSYVYHLNPTRKEVSPQGFVGQKTYANPKPAGVNRILALGDSIVFGVGVPHTDLAFPAVLERSLNKAKEGSAEVINAGVPGYTAYNELFFYQDHARPFTPDVVVVGFCMNDVVDPENHWFSTVPRAQRAQTKIPPEAIPNPVYHQTVTVPRDAARMKQANSQGAIRRALAQTALGRIFLTQTMVRSLPPPPTVTLNGKTWPVDLTGEDDLSIQVLVDYDSPESRWLHGIYDQLNKAVTDAGSKMVVVIFPLEYQLEDGYPFNPDEQILRYCQEKNILCLDMLPALKKHRDEHMFVGKETRPGSPIVRDIWHLSVAGHEVTAAELQSFLESHQLLGAK
jgi:lysophospholipase L1-like esterase